MSGMNYQAGNASLFSVAARNTSHAPKAECQSCHNEFTLGVNGTVDGCDECTGVTRDLAGFAWNNCSCLEYAGDDPKCPLHGGK